MDKKAFIDTVRRAQKKSSPLPQFTAEDVVSTTAISGTPMEAFKRNFKANHGEVFEDAAALVERLRQLGCKKGVADEKLIDTLGLEKEFELSREFDIENPDQYDFGISNGSFVIAEDGTIAMKDCDIADRMVSIAPWVHIAVVKKENIFTTIGEGLEKILENTPYAILVAGPSKTTDVEGVLVEGVHGPGKQICFFI